MSSCGSYCDKTSAYAASACAGICSHIGHRNISAWYFINARIVTHQCNGLPFGRLKSILKVSVQHALWNTYFLSFHGISGYGVHPHCLFLGFNKNLYVVSDHHATGVYVKSYGGDFIYTIQCSRKTIIIIF